MRAPLPSPLGPTLVVLALVGGACARSTPTSTTPVGEPLAALPQASTYAPPGATVMLRFDTARMRGLPFERELAAIVTAAPTWERLGYGSESDPIRDVDTMVCFSEPIDVSGRGILASEWTFVLTHPLEESVVRRRLEGMARASDRPFAWTSLEGFDAARLPVPESGFAEHAIVITAPREVVIAPAYDLGRVVARAREHRVLRDAGAPVVDPSLVPTSSDELALIEITTRPTDGATISLANGVETERIEAFRLLLRYVDAHLVGDAELRFASEAGAASASVAIASTLERLASQRTVQMLGIDRLVAALHSEVDGPRLRFGFALDDRLAAMALVLVSLASD